MMLRLSGENLKGKSYDCSGVIALFENVMLRICKCDILESIIARDLKLYQLIDDDE